MFVRRISQVRLFTGRHSMSSTPNSRSAMDLNMQTQRTRTSKDERQEMMAIWPDVVKDVIDSETLNDIPKITEWMSKSLNYNVPKGKMRRGILTIEAYKRLVPSNQLTEKNLRLARILGWCNQLIRAHSIVLDDLQNDSEIRRGQICWHRSDNIGLGAINDGVLLEHFAYKLLDIHFCDKSCYVNLMEDMMQNVYLMTIGKMVETLGLKTEDGSGINVSLCTMGLYNTMSKYRTSYNTLVSPVRLAMQFTGIDDPEMYRHAEENLSEICYFSQLEKDYNDCFGDSKVLKKVGTNIQKGKPTWFLAKALERATPEQINILEKCYGKDNPEKVAKVKQVYSDMKLEKAYLDYKEERCNLLKSQLTRYQNSRLRDICLYVLDNY